MVAANTPSIKELMDWKEKTARLIVERMREKCAEASATGEDAAGTAADEARAAKFTFMEKILEEHDTYPGHRKSPLVRVIKGYLSEFMRQSFDRVEPLNVLHGRNPTALEHWKSRETEFRTEEAISGVVHTAASYNTFRKSAGNGEHSAAFHAVGEVIRTTIDTFKEKFPEISDDEPRASLYNDHEAVIATAYKLRLIGSEHPPRRIDFGIHL